MESAGRRIRWSLGVLLGFTALAGGVLPSGCVLPKAELVEDDGSGARATGGRSGSGSGGRATAAGACDWNSRSCDDKSCASACPDPAKDGSYCLGTCNAVVDCVKRNSGCFTGADPVCAARNSLGQGTVCTDTWEMAGGNEPSVPAAAARALIECLCDQ